MLIIVSFLVCLGLFIAVGIASMRQSQGTTKDYLLAGHNIKPWLVALAAVATNCSGFMFIGLIGYTYSFGAAAITLMAPWVLGFFMASFLIHKRLRNVTEERDVITYASAISHWFGQDYKILRNISALLIIAFLGTYAAAQLSAGSKALHVLFDWKYEAGAILGSVIVLAYCFAGGIRASIWTNAVQSIVMFVAMIILFIAAYHEIGGWAAFVDALYAVSPTYMYFIPEGLPWGAFGGVAFVLGWLTAGYAVIGQPHIMTHFMTMDDTRNMVRVRWWYYGWFSTFSGFAIAAGFASRILLPEVAAFDSELALPTLALDLLPEILVGVILAGLFAATMSTADSQILNCTGAITHDMGFGRGNIIITKMATFFVTLTALLIALYGSDSVFVLVMVAWSALGAAFGPLLFYYAIGKRPTQAHSILIMGVGFLAMLLWRFEGPSADIYEVLPGVIAGLLAYPVGAVFFPRKKDKA